jgi:rhodanese-related sulfurtransferase
LENPVRALRNGAIGWTLAGQSLEHGQTRRAPEVRGQEAEAARVAAANVAYRAGVREIDVEGLERLAADPARTLYRFDVRQPEDYLRGHIPGFRNAEGGQLVQETDMFAPVRGARIVLADDHGVRAHMSASWLAQMGWEVYVLNGGFDGALETGPWRAARPRLPPAATLSPAALAGKIDEQRVLVVDVGPSKAHAKGHVPTACFVIRARLPSYALSLAAARLPVVFTSPDGALAHFAAADFFAITGVAARVLEGGTEAWRASGLPLEEDFKDPLSPPEDIYRRPYEGSDHSVEAMDSM